MQGKWRGQGHDNLCCSVHCPLEGLWVYCTTILVPDSYAAGQHALRGSPVQNGEDGWRETCSLLFSAGGESVGAVATS